MSMDESSSQSRNTLSKKRKKEKIQENCKDREVTDSTLESEKRKRKSKVKAGDEVGGAQEAKKKKRNQENRDKVEVQVLEGCNSPETTKKKKRRRETTDDELEPPKKKNRKLYFPDPEEDPTLSEQAQKALSYAFTQFRHPKKWKFHKARQNWLIRNFWSDKTIPDLHVALVLKYFATVQGGARENIMKTCTLIISPSQNEKAQESKEVSTGQQSIEHTGEPSMQHHDEIKRKRAMELLNILQTSLA